MAPLLGQKPQNQQDIYTSQILNFLGAAICQISFGKWQPRKFKI